RPAVREQNLGHKKSPLTIAMDEQRSPINTSVKRSRFTWVLLGKTAERIIAEKIRLMHAS
ncbi:MAG: hypothetical protein ACI87Q_001951, partial [Pseudohongiellaceae bacterium]